MPILNPIHELPKSETLNKLIDQYNVLVHDNNTARKNALIQIVETAQAHTTPNHPLLKAWMNSDEPTGLHNHLAYYNVRLDALTPQKNFKTSYMHQKTETPPIDEEKSVIKP